MHDTCAIMYYKECEFKVSLFQGTKRHLTLYFQLTCSICTLLSSLAAATLEG